MICVRSPLLAAAVGSLAVMLILSGCGAAREAARSNPQAAGSAAQAPAGPGAVGAAAPATSATRKIIYTAEVDLNTAHLDRTQQEMLRLLKVCGGYVAAEEITGDPGSPRTGRWTLRVPVDRYNEFMQAAPQLGELRRIHSDSEDVTAEFFDAQAHLANKRVEEQRLLQHLQRSTTRLSDILAIEKELSRVRGEIEQLQGRIRLLSNQTELTTITLTLTEVRGYTPSSSPTFTARAGRAFSQSFAALVETAQEFAVLAVVLLPWLLTASLVLGPLWAVIAWRVRARRKEQR